MKIVKNLLIFIIVIILLLVYINYLMCKAFTGGNGGTDDFIDKIFIPVKYCEYLIPEYGKKFQSPQMEFVPEIIVPVSTN